MFQVQELHGKLWVGSHASQDQVGTAHGLLSLLCFLQTMQQCALHACVWPMAQACLCMACGTGMCIPVPCTCCSPYSMQFTMPCVALYHRPPSTSASQVPQQNPSHGSAGRPPIAPNNQHTLDAQGRAHAQAQQQADPSQTAAQPSRPLSMSIPCSGLQPCSRKLCRAKKVRAGMEAAGLLILPTRLASFGICLPVMPSPHGLLPGSMLALRICGYAAAVVLLTGRVCAQTKVTLFMLPSCRRA